jgi:hypothetical protein
VHFSSGEVSSPSAIWPTDQHTILVVALPYSTTEDDLVGTGMPTGTPAIQAPGSPLLMFYNGRLRGHYWGAGDVAAIVDSSSNPTVGQATIVAQVFDGTTLHIFEDGTDVGSVVLNTGTVGATMPVVVGCRNIDGSYPQSHFQGEIAEALVYDTNLSDADRTSAEAYLRHKWGLGP